MDSPIAFRTPDGQEFFRSHPGPQTRALTEPAFEILYGGARGGGKSMALIAWFAMGNMALDPSDPLFCSYLNHKNFRGLVLRKNAADLKEFVSDATRFFQHFGLEGGKAKDDPPLFKFASGAIIYTNHLQSEDAFEKYKGANLHKLGIEELTLIDSQRAYLRAIGAVRSTIPQIRPQVFSTTNPDGNGSPWVRKRFVYPLAGGKRVPWGQRMRDPISGLTRVFIPARLSDNPSLGEDYRRVMLLQDEKTRRAWLDGDWDALTGTYFSGFRPNGPLAGEPDAARHVIPSSPARLMPWWPRHIGVDWGYKHNAACYWLCQNQEDDRLHVYRELVGSGIGAEQLGAKIALLSLEELAGQPGLQIPLYLSHDAFNVQDVTKTKAQLIQSGIESVLGSGSALLVGRGGSLIDIPEGFDEEARILIHRAGTERVGVWQWLRSLLRFTPMVDLGKPDPAYARKLLEEPDGQVKYEKYISAFERKKEVLPGLLIWDNCPRLIEALSSAVHDDKKPEDILEDGKEHSNDELDALRHALMFLQKLENEMPKQYWMAERMKRAENYQTDPNLMRQIWSKAEHDYASSHEIDRIYRLPRTSFRERTQ